MDLAIVGVPQSGRTTLFRALTSGHGASPADGGRGELLGTVKIPDDRLEKLAVLVKAKKITPLEIVLHDLPAIFHKGSGPSGTAGETLAKADALLHVVRAFDRPDAPHPAGSVDPHRDIAAFDSELMFFDLGIVERRLDKLQQSLKGGKALDREAAAHEQKLLQRVKQTLEADKPLRNAITDPADIRALANYGLLSIRPMLLVVNVSEDEVADQPKTAEEFQARYGAEFTRATAISTKLEAELAELPPDEAAEFRGEMGAPEGGTDTILDEVRQLLDLVTFFTAGEQDTRAWTVPTGSSALVAAGRIHTDIARGFIRAEVIGWEELLEFGTHAEARKHGKLRQEGKTYVIREGDVINVLFNV